MEKIVGRHKNVTVLALALVLQVIVLGIQVKRPSESGSVSLIRVWTIRAVTPVEKVLVHGTNWIEDAWHGYFYLRGLRVENERLQNENFQLRMEQVRMLQDASQAQRLQALLKFKEQYTSETVAAQVIGTSGTESSRILFIDKGSNDGLRQDMAVVTPTGVVGKVVRISPATAQVLEINDQSSGIGAILEKSRLQGILKGTPSGDAMLHYVMNDEKVEVGETVLTSGGDRIFPKGLPIGTVVAATPGPDMFLKIRVKPAAQLDRIEELLVITKIDDRQPDLLPENPQRAADILAARLPSVPVKPPDATPGTAGGGTQPATPASAVAGATAPKPQGSQTAQPASGTAKVAQPAATKTAATGVSAAGTKPTVNNGPAKLTNPAARPAATAGGAGAIKTQPSGSTSTGRTGQRQQGTGRPGNGPAGTAAKPAEASQQKPATPSQPR